ncbi:biotin--[acetyl-CoA-carboxylase] ligase [Plastorhodobacter daqingensis]|uniref:biotin--[biotin carboxyl-carrier protein] ligase n=1 Tax=Plastorhodobacter daqingensis TaxID=1387281 RepID=A0ABW2UFK2_9RHOB
MTWPTGVGRHVLDVVDSTMTEAARMAPTLSGPAWILGLRQTAGRGRRGRAWVDPAGNFAATLVMRPADPPERMALRSFVAALALHETFVTVTGRAEPFALKWPNDVLLNGAKVAGILLESSSASTGHLAIGIGVNLVSAPGGNEVEAGALRPVSLLSETGARVTPEEFLDILAPAFARWEAQFATYGFGPIRTAWMARAARLGETVMARAGTQSHEGRFIELDDQGALILVTARGRVAIPAGEVFFG